MSYKMGNDDIFVRIWSWNYLRRENYSLDNQLYVIFFSFFYNIG